MKKIICPKCKGLIEIKKKKVEFEGEFIGYNEYPKCTKCDTTFEMTERKGKVIL